MKGLSVMIDSCCVYLQAFFCSQLVFERREQRGQNHTEMTSQGVSGHHREESQDTSVHRRSC